MFSAKLLMSITIALLGLLIIMFYCLMKLKIKKIRTAKNIFELDKGTLRYLEKNNYSKDVILAKIETKIHHMDNSIVRTEKFILIAVIFILLYFLLRITDLLMKIKIDEKIFLYNQIVYILIMLLLIPMGIVFITKFTQKYMKFLSEQLTRLL